MSTDDPGQPGNFRERLAGIPRIDDEPLELGSPSLERPPVVRRAAPIARPNPVEDPQSGTAPSYETTSTPELGEDQEWPIGARRRRRWPLVLMALLLLVGLAILLPVFRARQVFNQVERVPVAESLTAPAVDGVNILLVGTDSRAGIDGSTENAGAIIGGDPITGERTDTIMILRLQEDGTAKFLSLPRDLWLPIDGGDSGRINGAFRSGPEALISTIQSELGIPLSHYVQVDLVGFIGLVDAVGGVDITIAHPAFDTRSGLDLPTAGVVTLDSTQALAFVRSRFYTERIDGVEIVDGTSDLGRVQRQQSFMRALFATVAEQRDPRVLDSMGTAMAAAIVIDDQTSLSDAVSIANTLRSVTPESVVLPTRNATVGSAAVLELTEEAPEILAQFGANSS